MCLELLLELADSGRASGPIADLGTGSGVLAIAAAKLGWAPVIAVDHEPAALEAAAANAAANGVELDLRRVNLRQEAPPAAATVVANLTAPLLRETSARLPAAVELIVCSGLLATEVGDVVAALAAAGLRDRDRREKGDWVAVCFRRQ
jgi:ribosomal protein L11 methyltransferase